MQLLTGIGKLLLHPLLYFSILLTFSIGSLRVKRERKDFDVSIYDIYHEMRQIFPQGILIGMILSCLMLFIGLTIPMSYIVGIGTATLILSLIGGIFLSVPFTLIGGILLILLAEKIGIEIPFSNGAFIDHLPLTSMAILLAFLLIAEGVLIFRNAWKGTSPTLIKSPRGLNVGAHLTQRLWVVPILLLIPSGDLHSSFSWWPVIQIGSQSFALFAVPFLIGFKQIIRSTLPEVAIKKMGRSVMWMGIITFILAIPSYWFPMMIYVVLAFAFIGRAWIHMRYNQLDKKQPYYFTQQKAGVRILGVIPYTPADKMELKIGELIKKVNGVEVSNEENFYQALQRNRAYCRMEVIGANGENRFVQSALYEGQHHELGIIFVQEDKNWDEDAVS